MLDGATRPIASSDDLRPGMILRMVNSDGTFAPFSDCVVLSVNGDGARLARPYAFGSSLDSIVPSPLLGCETFTASRSRMERFVIVLDSRGEPCRFAT